MLWITAMARHRHDLPEYMDAELAHLQDLLRQKETAASYARRRS